MLPTAEKLGCGSFFIGPETADIERPKTSPPTSC